MIESIDQCRDLCKVFMDFAVFIGTGLGFLSGFLVGLAGGTND
jgi:hypothetical protein